MPRVIIRHALKTMVEQGGRFVDLDLGGLKDFVWVTGSIDECPLDNEVGKVGNESRRPCSSIKVFNYLVMSMEPQIMARSVSGDRRGTL